MSTSSSRRRTIALLVPVRRLATRAKASGALHLAVSVVLVQGTSYVAQLVVAQLLGPESFGMVRAVEAVVAAALTLAQCGLPSLAIRGVAGLDVAARDTMVRRLLLAGLLSSGVVVVALAVGAPWLAGTEGARWLRRLAPTLVLSVTGRIAIGVLQGVRRVQDAATASIVAAVLGALSVLLATHRLGVAGWAWGRVLAEVLLAFVLVATLRPSLLRGQRWALPPISMFRDGFLISSALLLRSVLDHLVVPLLLWLGLSASEAGKFGLSVLLAFPALLVPGVIGNLVIPRFVVLLDQPDALRRLFRRSVLGSTATALGLVVIFALVGPIVIRWALPAFRESIGTLLLLLIAAPLRAAPISMGGLLLAAQDVRSPVVINATCLVVLAVCAAWWVPQFGARGGAFAVIASEAASLTGYLIAANRILRARGRT